MTNSATLIDNIFTNVLNEKNYSGILMADLSDYLPVFEVTKNVCYVSKEDEFMTKRIINQTRLDLFKRDLQIVAWESLLNITNPNDQYPNFGNLFLNLYDKHFPKQKFKIRQRRKPWLSNSLINCCWKKKLYKIF